MTQRLLTPTEAAFLLAPKSRSARECLQAALLSLLSSGRIAIEQSNSVFKETALILTGNETARPLPSHLKAVDEALTSYGGGDRLVSSKVLQALQKRFGSDYRRYVHDEVAPALIRRDLLLRKDSKWLGLFPKISYEHTPRGAAITAPLDRLMSAVNQVPSLIESDPDEALRVALAAGALLVMSPPARRQLPALRKLLTERGDDYVPLTTMPGMTDDEGSDAGRLLDLIDMALSLDVGTLFDGIDAVGDFTSGSDSSSSDGGDGGGGGGD